MKSADQKEQGDEPAVSTEQAASMDSSTLRTSQSDQARGYLESLADNDFMAEIQNALEQAQRLTKQAWKLSITADNVEIHCEETSKRIKLPRPKHLDDQKRD